MDKEQHVSWSEIDSLIEQFSALILKSKKKFSSITTLSRGGLVPSRLLADHLGIEKIFVDEKLFLLIPWLLMISLILEIHLIGLF